MTIHTDDAAARRGLLLIASAAVLWGTVGIATRQLYAISAANPLSIGLFRLALAVPVLLLALRVYHRERFAYTRRDWLAMASIGLLLAVYQVCFFSAIPLVGVAVATLVTLCTAPVLVALLTAATGRERLTRATGVALLCAIVGTVLLSGIDVGAANGGSQLAGVLFALGAAFGYALMPIVGRGLGGRSEPLLVNTVAFASGALILLPAAATSGLVVEYPVQGWLLLVYLGVVPSALGYVLFFSGMRSVSATTASIVTLAEPLVATVLAWLIFQERLGVLGGVGALLLLGALTVLFRAAR